MESDNPLITVYIPCHNYARYLEGSIDSVLKQTYENWELIVIDDGSSDNTQEIFELYKGHAKIHFETTRVLVYQVFAI